MTQPTIIVHGGAGTISSRTWSDFRLHTNKAALLGQAVLDQGGSALDAAVAATVYMEDEVTFNAGYSSSLNAEGKVQMDALVMTDDYLSGAVAGVERVKNVILLARAVMEHTPHHLIVGRGAELLAEEHSLERCSDADLISPRRLARYQQMVAGGIYFHDDPEREARDDPEEDSQSDTVGACALDTAGHFAAASSTGGMMRKHVGRAGDVPVVGAGTYVGPAGAVTCTGHGEMAIRVCLAKYAYDLLLKGQDAGEAARLAIEHLVDTVGGQCGLVIIDQASNRGWATSTQRIGVGIPERELAGESGCIPASPASH